MNIILNHTIRSIKDNKVQVALIITTIAIVTVMIFVALSMTGLFYNLNINAESRLGAGSDIIVRGEVFSKSKLDDYISQSNKIENVDYYYQTAGLVKRENETRIIMLEATDFRNLYQRYPHKLITDEVAKNDFEYPAIWIGRDFAKDLAVKAGDTLEIYYQGEQRYQNFSISRIMKNQGFFADVSVNNILIDYSNINNRGMINTALLKLKDKSDFEKTKTELKQFMQNDALEVESAINYQRILQIVSNNTKLLNVALAFIMTIMGLILFTSYLVIAKGRLNEMIIFKAAGATPHQVTLIMLFEVALYGAIGATIGLILGRLGMGVATKLLLPNFPKAISYNIWKFIVAFIVGVGVSVVSALLPIMKISKKSIREMSSGIVKDIKYTHPIIIFIITIVVIVCFVLLMIFAELVVPMTIALIALFALWLSFAIPYLVRWASFLFSHTKRQSQLASISIKRNSSTNTLTILVGAVITFSFIVVSVINLIVTAIVPYNTRYEADYVINSSEEIAYEQLSSELLTIDGIKDIAYYRTAGFEYRIDDKNILTYQVIGINDAQALQYATKLLNDKVITEFEKLDNPIVLNNDIAMRLGLKIGDTVTISRPSSIGDMESLEKLDAEFMVVGIDYSVTEYDRLVYIKLEDMVSNGRQISFEEEKMFLSAYDSVDYQDLYLSIRDRLSSRPQFFVLKFSEWAFATVKGLQGVTMLLRLIQILVSLVAFVGVINLTIVTFADRKEEYTVYKSSGMSVKDYNWLSLFEGIIIGFVGAMIGIVLSFFFNILMPSFSKLINKYLIYSIFPLSMPLISLVAFIVYVMIYSLISIGNNKIYRSLGYYNRREKL